MGGGGGGGGGAGYSVWGRLSDLDHRYVKHCEVMIKFMCNAIRSTLLLRLVNLANTKWRKKPKK